MREFRQDFALALEFFRILRWVRANNPNETLFWRLHRAVEVLRQETVRAQTLWAMKHGSSQ